MMRLSKLGPTSPKLLLSKRFLTLSSISEPISFSRVVWGCIIRQFFMTSSYTCQSQESKHILRLLIIKAKDQLLTFLMYLDKLMRQARFLLQVNRISSLHFYSFYKSIDFSCIRFICFMFGTFQIIFKVLFMFFILIFNLVITFIFDKILFILSMINLSSADFFRVEKNYLPSSQKLILSVIFNK